MQKVVAVHDLSCVGRCSLTVVLPILSALGLQVCPLPTAVLSTHPAGFKNVVCQEMTGQMRQFSQQWQENQLEFDCVYTGFLASSEQIQVTKNIIRQFAQQDKTILVDPVMGDDGQAYSLTTPELIEEMRSLVAQASIITPNYTEACFLLQRPYLGNKVQSAQLLPWLVELANLGPQQVVITGIPQGEDVVTLAYERVHQCFYRYANRRVGGKYPGTGDLFASILLGRLLGGMGLGLAIQAAGDFVAQAITSTRELGLPVREGVAFEALIQQLND
ncbi:MAG: pyridoxamine kinase [Acidaminococcaceae bacterium]